LVFSRRERPGIFFVALPDTGHPKPAGQFVHSVSPKKIDRVVACQAFLDARGRGHYLEIGFCAGQSFIPIRAQAKWGVDPAYFVPRRRLWKFRLFTALRWREERLFRMTSDEFFRRQHHLLARRGVDVALIDGLHTYEQALRDVLHTLPHLRAGGVIVLHDCNPASEHAATPAASYAAMMDKSPPGWNCTWNGDVWKVIVHLRSLRPDLETVVLDCDQGLGIVRRKQGRVPLRFSAEQIAGMQYADLHRDRQELLGLRAPEYLWEMVADGRRE
jgi:hypothetical protein